MGAEETCRLAAELVEEFGEQVSRVAERAIATFEADGFADRALTWRAIHAILARHRGQALRSLRADRHPLDIADFCAV